MRRGITLLELLCSLTIIVVVTIVSTRSLVSALNYESRLRSGRDAITERDLFESKLIDLLHHAWLSSSTTDQNCYFVGGTPTVLNSTGTTAATATTGTTGAGSTSSTAASSGGGGGGGGTGAYGTPNVMVFTVAGMRLTGAFLASKDDFETNNQNFGPEGGVTEVELSETPVGSGGQGETGLFLRTQTPSDNDPTQGGNEYNLCSDVSQIGFEFFDGINWDQSWDNRVQTPAPGRLPAAVRITYRLNGDTYDHVLIVQIPASNVTYLNPVTVTG